MGLISLTASPSGWLLPVLLLLMALELAIIFGKRLRCGAAAREVRRLTVRRYEIAREIKGVSGRMMHLAAVAERVDSPDVCLITIMFVFLTPSWLSLRTS